MHISSPSSTPTIPSSLLAQQLFFPNRPQHYTMSASLLTAGDRQIWNMAIHEGKFHLDHVKRLNHMDPAGFNFSAAITCTLPMPLVLYTGDEDGRVVGHLYAFRVKALR